MTQPLFGLDFATGVSIDEVAESLFLDRDVRDGMWRCVVTPNVDHIVRYDRHPAEFAVAATATMVLPDGMPIVWASRLVGRPLGQRLAGSDLFPALWRQLAAHRVPTVVVAASTDVAARLEAEHANLRCVVPPMFDAGDDAAVTRLVDEIVDASNSSAARFVLVGLSMPKHHRIGGELHTRWAGTRDDAPTVMLLGASAELYLGLMRRAPAWMQRSGTEWVYRLVKEPRRLVKRYLVDDVRFLAIFVREWRATRRRR